MKTEYRPVDRLEHELVDLEALKSRITARQLELLRELDVAQVAGLDGAKTMGEWATRVLDTSTGEGRDLVRLARSIDPRLEADLAEGNVSTRRALTESALAAAGASDDLIARSRGFDIAGVRRLTTQLRSFTTADEIAAFETRRLVLQPNLDESVWKYWGQTTGLSGRAMANALDQRADDLYRGEPKRPARPQRKRERERERERERHHITPASAGGPTTPENLATVCWFHHHIVIHGHGKQLDPTTPPHRRRFLRPPTRGPDPSQ